ARWRIWSVNTRALASTLPYVSYGNWGSSPSLRTSYRSDGKRVLSSSNEPSSAFEPYPPTNRTSSRLRAGARRGSAIGVSAGAMVGVGAERISLGLSSVSGMLLEVGGWPVPLGAGGRPSSALAVSPPAERRASAMTDARMRTPGVTPRSQQMEAPGSHRRSGRYRSTALRPGSRHLARLRARGKFVGIVEWFEPRVLVSPFDRPREKAVRKPRVLREARSVEIATDHFSLYRALGLVFAVVAVSGDDRSERLRAGAEVRPPGVVLEPDERSVGRIHQQIAHEALPAGASGHVENAQPWYRGADLRHVLVSEELIAAADREDRGAALDGLPQARAVLAHQIGADDVLPLILAAAEEPHVGPQWVGPFANGVGPHLDADPAPFRALGERDDVAAVAV